MADDPEETELNTKAFFALEGGSLDCTGDLIRLLRSSDPIHPIVRARLADALDGGTPGGASLVLRNHKSGNDTWRGIFSRKRKIEIGHFIQSLIDNGTSPGKAIERAEHEKVASYKLCEGALTFYRKAAALADEWEALPEFRDLDRWMLLHLCSNHVDKPPHPAKPRPRRSPSRSST